MSAPDEEIGRKAVSGIRWVLILNVATIPFSFATNLLLGHVSSVALGYYSAVQVFAAGFQSFVVLGGENVFTRFVPSLPIERRWSFFASYVALVTGVAASVLSVAFLAIPARTNALLGRFGGPPALLVIALSLATMIWSFCSYFLYGNLDARGAAMTLRGVVVGFFVAAVAGFVFARPLLESNPGAFLWIAGALVYGIAAALGVTLVLRSEAFARREPIRWGFPPRFGEAVVYTHLQTLVSFAYTSLAPSLVLLWLDVSSLGYLHAALRFPVLVGVPPVMMASVIGPVVSAHVSAGQREEAFRRVRRALDGAVALVVPPSIVLACFAADAMRIFGPSFPAHRDLLRILTVATVAAPMVYIGASVAVALHEFRGYFGISILFLTTNVGLTALLIPRIGIRGAAFAALAGAFVQSVAVAALLRARFGFRASRRLGWAWIWTAASAAVCIVLDPGRLGGALVALPAIAAFAWTGRVSIAEVTDALRKLAGRA